MMRVGACQDNVLGVLHARNMSLELVCVAIYERS